jgi:hypothetical protein
MVNSERPFDPVYTCAYTWTVSFEWDREKAGVNLRKHGVDFADAVGVFEDEMAVTVDDPWPGYASFPPARLREPSGSSTRRSDEAKL